MRVFRSLICAALLTLVCPPAIAAAQPPPPQAPGQEEFVPLSEIPPEEQIPAFTLVAAAYAAVWIVLIGYVWSLSRRLHAVETEVRSLARRRETE